MRTTLGARLRGLPPRPTPWRRSRVDPAVTEVEDLLKPLRSPAASDPVAERQRAQAHDVVQSRVLGEPKVDVATEDHLIRLDRYPDTRLRIYWPSDRRPAAGDALLPVFLHFFGGGFTVGGIDWDGWDVIQRRRAQDAGVIVVAGEYSLAPEVRFPAQPEQGHAILTWVAEHLAEIGGDPAALAIGGASSGGNLAAVVAMMNRDRDRIPLRLQILENPVLDLTGAYLDPIGFGRPVPRPLLRPMVRRVVARYLGSDPAKAGEPYASPLLASDLSGLPPALIHTAELDPLRSNGEAYARALSAAGVPVTAVRYIGQTHTSGGFTGYVPAADHLHSGIVSALRDLARPPVDHQSARRVAAERAVAEGERVSR